MVYRAILLLCWLLNYPSDVDSKQVYFEQNQCFTVAGNGNKRSLQHLLSFAVFFFQSAIALLHQASSEGSANSTKQERNAVNDYLFHTFEIGRKDA
jgi:hypothetical protein